MQTKRCTSHGGPGDQPTPPELAIAPLLCAPFILCTCGKYQELWMQCSTETETLICLEQDDAPQLSL